eukprot:1139049-Pelagomonas_calceolata.AAC.13
MSVQHTYDSRLGLAYSIDLLRTWRTGAKVEPYHNIRVACELKSGPAHRVLDAEAQKQPCPQELMTKGTYLVLRSIPTTASKWRVSSKAALPTEQPRSRARDKGWPVRPHQAAASCAHRA